MTSTYPSPSINPTWHTITPRKFLPAYPPPQPLEYPSIPTPPCQPDNGKFIVSTHIIPAAHTRTRPYVPFPPLPPPGSSKAERMAYNKKALLQLRQNSFPDPSASGYTMVMWNCINRYVRKGASGTGLTLFFAHANGFPKEIWEPVITRLFNSPSGQLVDEIWAWEAVQHGDSALLNKDMLGLTFDWCDNGRDILNFFHYFIPSSISDGPLPEHLPQVSSEETQYRKTHGFKNRTLIGIGHSYGGCTTLFAALENPKLFDKLVLVDPVINEPPSAQEFAAAPETADTLIIGAMSRRDTWSSKEEALAGFKKSPFFAAWDPKVLDIYVERGLYTTTDANGQSIAKLKQSGILEGVVFSAILTQFEVFHLAQKLDERVELRWIVPGKPGAGELGPPGSTRKRVWVRPKNSSNIRIHSAGHLIPQEAPSDLVQELDNFIASRYNAPISGIKSNF